MRLDKYICECTSTTRSEAKKSLHQGLVCCNDKIIKDPKHKVSEADIITFNGEIIRLLGPRFIMLNKPTGIICSTQDEVYPCVLSLLNVKKTETLHVAGRLDVDTTGLVLITDDGAWSHLVTSPKKECGKRYRVTLAEPIKKELISTFLQGVQLRGEDTLTKPAKLELINDHDALLTITEGKYHQVKRMFAALGNKVVSLHRESIGLIELDSALAAGEWRYLTEREIHSIKS